MIAAACHIHSEWSYDAQWPLSDLVREFEPRGYRVLMVTEHDKGFTEQRRLAHCEACAQASTEKVLVLPGIEYSDAENRVHVLVWGRVPFIGERVPTSELLSAVNLAHGIAVLAHPSRRDAWRIFDPAWATYLLGIEVWNRKTDGWAPSRAALRLVEETNTLPFVGMDFHERKQIFPLAMALDVATVNEDSVLQSLQMRRCTALGMGRPIDSIARGWSVFTLASAERLRRSAARLYRRIKQR